jgi:hypothetical protein
MKRVAFAVAAGFAVVGVVAPRAEQRVLRYPDVEPIFAKRCASCHDVRTSTNAKAQAVFEMSSYPFATQRPARLLDDLRRALPTRVPDADEQRLGMQWLETGALDATGQPPRWR